MTEYEAYQEHIRYTHDTYCRIVIRHASFDAARMLAAQWKREISLEYLTEEKFVPLSTIDEYFQVPDYGECLAAAESEEMEVLSGMSRLLPYETILKAREGDPEAVNAVLLHYAGYIRYFSKVNGQVNAEVEDYVKQRLIDCQFKFRLDEPPDKS